MSIKWIIIERTQSGIVHLLIDWENAIKKFLHETKFNITLESPPEKPGPIVGNPRFWRTQTETVGQLIRFTSFPRKKSFRDVLTNQKSAFLVESFGLDCKHNMANLCHTEEFRRDNV